MTRLIKQAIVRETGVMRPVPVMTEITSFETLEDPGTEWDCIEDKFLELRIRSKFSVGRMSRRGRELAEKNIKELIYGDVNALLNGLRLAVNNCEVEKAMSIIDEIESITTVT